MTSFGFPTKRRSSFLRPAFAPTFLRLLRFLVLSALKSREGGCDQFREFVRPPSKRSISAINSSIIAINSSRDFSSIRRLTVSAITLVITPLL